MSEWVGLVEIDVQKKLLAGVLEILHLARDAERMGGGFAAYVETEREILGSKFVANERSRTAKLALPQGIINTLVKVLLNVSEKMQEKDDDVLSVIMREVELTGQLGLKENGHVAVMKLIENFQDQNDQTKEKVITILAKLQQCTKLSPKTKSIPLEAQALMSSYNGWKGNNLLDADVIEKLFTNTYSANEAKFDRESIAQGFAVTPAFMQFGTLDSVANSMSKPIGVEFLGKGLENALLNHFGERIDSVNVSSETADDAFEKTVAHLVASSGSTTPAWESAFDYYVYLLSHFILQENIAHDIVKRRFLEFAIKKKFGMSGDDGVSEGITESSTFRVSKIWTLVLRAYNYMLLKTADAASFSSFGSSDFSALEKSHLHERETYVEILGCLLEQGESLISPASHSTALRDNLRSQVDALEKARTISFILQRDYFSDGKLIERKLITGANPAGLRGAAQAEKTSQCTATSTFTVKEIEKSIVPAIEFLSDIFETNVTKSSFIGKEAVFVAYKGLANITGVFTGSLGPVQCASFGMDKDFDEEQYKIAEEEFENEKLKPLNAKIAKKKGEFERLDKYIGLREKLDLLNEKLEKKKDLEKGETKEHCETEFKAVVSEIQHMEELYEADFFAVYKFKVGGCQERGWMGNAWHMVKEEVDELEKKKAEEIEAFKKSHKIETSKYISKLLHPSNQNFSFLPTLRHHVLDKLEAEATINSNRWSCKLVLGVGKKNAF